MNKLKWIAVIAAGLFVSSCGILFAASLYSVVTSPSEMAQVRAEHDARVAVRQAQVEQAAGVDPVNDALERTAKRNEDPNQPHIFRPETLRALRSAREQMSGLEAETRCKSNARRVAAGEC